MEMSEQKETVNESEQQQIINRLLEQTKLNREYVDRVLKEHPKLSKQEKLILEALIPENVFGNFRDSKDIAFFIVSQKHGKEPYELHDYSEELHISTEEFNALSKEQKDEYLRKKRFAYGTGKFIHAFARLPHFLAQLKKDDPLEIAVEDVYNFVEGPGYFKHSTKKELLRQANSIRASVCRSLKRLMNRGLIVSLTVTEAYTIFGKRNKWMEKTFYFLTKQQGQRAVDEDKICMMKGVWKSKKEVEQQC